MADLRGHESHGVSNCIHTYYRPASKKARSTCAEARIVQETATTAPLDGDGGMGSVVGLHHARLHRAGGCTAGFASVAAGRHFGMASLSLIAIEHGTIGLAMTSGGAGAVPFGGLDPRFGTNPISVAIPAARSRRSCWTWRRRWSPWARS